MNASSMGTKKHQSPYLTVTVVSLLCAALYFSGLETTLAYQRDLIKDGQVWRLLTGNFLHTNHWHLLMNVAGLWTIVLLHEVHYRAKDLAILIAVLALMQGLSLLIFFPETKGYVGLSGVLHGLFIYGAVRDINHGMKTGYLLTLGVIVKVAYEQIYGASHEITALIGARVATESHFIGVVSGICCLGGLYVFRRATP